ncbi:MAG: hypothetical protein DRN12_01380 [Thermoplasmata archaeon]|nr:MAG: hypothetical protein DRN12_01380 [Thermoplasmata archaeon]
MKLIWYIIPILLILPLSGCLDLFEDILATEVIYEERPTELSYKISYGYNIHCIGDGFHQIHYILDIPDVLEGDIAVTEILMEDRSTMVYHANNSMISWNITGRHTADYKLGLSASITAGSFLIEDLKGSKADTIEDINLYHPDIVRRYTHPQGNKTITFIDPYNPSIKSTAQSVIGDTDNVFLAAKKLFIWLKTYTTYKPHIGSEEVQPASTTFIKKTGDCDDLTFLYLSLCRAIDIPSRFIKGYIIEENQGDIECIPHVWAEVYVGDKLGWIPVECAGEGKPEAEVDQDFGVEDPFHLRLFIDDGSNESIRVTFTNLIVKYDNSIEVEMQSYVDIIDYSVLESKEMVVKNNIRSYR